VNVFIFILFCIVAFVFGILVGRKGLTEETVGTIIIDHESVPEDEPYMFLQSKVNPRVLMKKKTAVFNISIEKLISHK
jgi:hypothetical protein